MVVNFRARGISHGARKLARILTSIFFLKKNLDNKSFYMVIDDLLPNSGDPHHLLS